MTPYLPQATPLPVEITNQTDWWQPYVPPLVGLVGSILQQLWRSTVCIKVMGPTNARLTRPTTAN